MAFSSWQNAPSGMHNGWRGAAKCGQARSGAGRYVDAQQNKSYMKTSLLVLTLIAALSATPLLAEDAMKCGCMKEPDAKAEMQKKMEAKMKAGEAELNALVEQMNSTTGDKKVEAMSALLNKLLQERKAMHAKMAEMSGTSGSSASEKKLDGDAAKPAEHQH